MKITPDMVPLWSRKGKDKNGRSISDEAFTKRLKKKLKKRKRKKKK